VIRIARVKLLSRCSDVPTTIAIRTVDHGSSNLPFNVMSISISTLVDLCFSQNSQSSGRRPHDEGHRRRDQIGYRIQVGSRERETVSINYGQPCHFVLAWTARTNSNLRWRHYSIHFRCRQSNSDDRRFEQREQGTCGVKFRRSSVDTCFSASRSLLFLEYITIRYPYFSILFYSIASSYSPSILHLASISLDES
jgi:hypothetical protein